MRPTDTRLVMLSFNLPTGPDHLSPPTRLSVKKKRGLTDGASGLQRVRSWFFHSPPSRHVQRLISALPSDRNIFPSLTLFMKNPTDLDKRRSTAHQKLRYGAKKCYGELLFYEFKQFHTSKNSVYPKLVAIAKVVLIF